MQRYSFFEKNVLFQPACLNRDKLKRHIEGKTVLITGASSGIGERLACMLAEFRVHLIVVARREERLLALQRAAEAKAATVSVFPADLRDRQQLEHLLDFLHQLPDGVDILVSNAGHSIRRSIADSCNRFHDFARTMDINYFAPVQLVLSLLPLLAGNNGQVINVSTINALLPPFPHWAAYQASKTAFDTWLRSAEPELNRMGIATTSLYLPLVRTPMIAPTPAYQHAPAMSPEHAARLIGKAIYTKKRTLKPWWLVFVQLAALLFGQLWTFVAAKWMKQG